MLIIRRINSIDDISYNIMIDGVEMGILKPNSEKKLRLRSNKYKIQLEAYKDGIKFSSNEIEFYMKDDVEFICSQNYFNNVISKFIHCEVFHKGIKLKRKMLKNKEK